MTLTFTQEHKALRTALRDFLEAKAPPSEVQRLAESEDGFDAPMWRQLSDMLGLPGLIVPEEFGGSGAGHVELGIVLEEMGRGLTPAPLFSTVVLATNTLLLSGDRAAQGAYLPDIATGQLRATLAVSEDAAAWSADRVRTQARSDGGGWVLDGVKDHVLDGGSAHLILVLACVEDSTALFAVDGSAQGLARTPLETLDRTRRQARLELAATPAVLVGEVGNGWHTIEQVLDRALVALAAEQVGGAEHVLEMAVDYARTRVQFGRQIGSFQAVKHRCADMLIDVERAKVAAYQALWSIDYAPGDVPVAARLAKAFCSDVFFDAAASNIQVHGGIGFTWEHPAHLYYRRAKTAQLQLGSPSHHREALLQLLGL